MKKGTVLIVDDNTTILVALKLLLQPHFKSVKTIENPNLLLSFPNLKEVDVLLLDMNFTKGTNTGNEGLYWFQRIHELAPNTSVVMMTAYGDVELVVKTLKKGATDFVLKPWDNKKLLATVQSAYQLSRSNKEVNSLKENEKNLKSLINAPNTDAIIGQSSAFKAVMSMVEKVAKTDANILITGENGTGKEIIAKKIQALSTRKNNLLISVDLGAIPESLFESELFGHKKGAYTDAIEDRVGKFEIANKGTLFLDEIGNTPIQLQSKLLQVLQNRTITKVGENKQIPIDIRLICATNCNLEQMVADGSFREDLLYRINTIHIELPALRDRKEDIALLTKHYLALFAKKYNKPNIKIHASALQKLEKHTWPGNIRELKHTVERIVILTESMQITSNDIFFKNSKNTRFKEDVTLDEMEKNMIINALEKHDGNMSTAAKQLGITRQTLYNKTKKHLPK
ncbi:sigma-54-dependent Fis family transcriptional regulator [Polaribacter pacificus]|uniref:Sigma-54-dependent Fis family transcriptional regulator n=1 Tax=Polaribacter pacificus TaxID=1775173 RepID=A0A917HXG7_9FLAO|nr:sigma-54 dependent transcriptional regulator [Polaribacter pacificus]GGG94062.1 sigma-54-dependent Fis family transcriptional regulator [Polaribacter pacificus]